MDIPENVRLPPFLCIYHSLVSVTDSWSVFTADSYDLCGVSGIAVAGSWNRVSCTEPTRSRYVIFQVDFHFPLMMRRKLSKTKRDIEFLQFFYKFLHSQCEIYISSNWEKYVNIENGSQVQKSWQKFFYNIEQIKFTKS